MNKPIGSALLISGLTALGLYLYRRRLLSRLLGLLPALYDVAVEHGLRVPMPEGVELVADLEVIASGCRCRVGRTRAGIATSARKNRYPWLRL